MDPSACPCRCLRGMRALLGLPSTAIVNVNVNVNNLLAIFESDFDNSGEPGPQAEGVNHLRRRFRHWILFHGHKGPPKQEPQVAQTLTLQTAVARRPRHTLVAASHPACRCIVRVRGHRRHGRSQPRADRLAKPRVDTIDRTQQQHLRLPVRRGASARP